MLKFSSITCAILFFQLALSQSNVELKVYYSAYDSISGYEHSVLYNGLRYKDAYRSTKDNHRFFDHHDFLKGDIVYDGQPFYNLDLKYDLYKDVLVVKLKGDKSFFNLELNTHKLNSATINNSHFINMSSNKSLIELGLEGLLEQKTNENPLTFFIKRTKDMKERIKGNHVEHLFKKKDTYLFLYKDIFYEINSKNDVTKLFPNQSKEIKDFYKNYKILLNSNPEEFMEKMAVMINKQLNTNHQ